MLTEKVSIEETILKFPRSGYIALGISPNFSALLCTARVKFLPEFENFSIIMSIYFILVITKSVNINFRTFLLAPVTRNILRPEPRWRPLSRHFGKTKFER